MIFLRTRPVSHRGTGPSQVPSLPSVYCKKLFPDVRKRPDQVGAPLMYQLFPLEAELQCELYQARFACPLHAAKIAPVRSISVRLVELRMVEHIIDFAAELQFVALSDLGVLEYAEIRLELAWATANRAGCVADGAKHHAAGLVRAKRVV